ncbi:protein translocase subunit SecF [archaeon]|jgi:preprotein translocase subunit SecF|nr:protein translocase subunit SecF [archaeon]MBT4373091.1 protein translocase subunit SecF [archaeon]MBT4531436.1 protein translocase subunit SecF [archaeon]MBT7001386.1 protein translocase subunit SecF [archaeon]MBT7282128.1 protein translocase subunit SecF [archaeon]
MEEQTNFGKFHDKNYKKLLLIPTILLIFAIGYMFYFYSSTGDFIYKDISLTGGTTITLYDDINLNQLKLDLSGKLEDLNTRSIYDLITQEQKAIIVETKTDSEITRQVLEEYLGYELTSDNSSFEFTGSTLSESFFKQLLVAILIAFIFMALVVFLIFRTFVPSTAVIISAFADIVMTLALVNLIGMKMSSAGIVAFLMLIGYSVDTDILLTTRLLKRSEGSLNKRAFSAFKTGMTMTLTSLLAIIFAFFIAKSFSVVLTQIFSILIIGLGFDILNTWITNVSILKWYLKNEINN